MSKDRLDCRRAAFRLAPGGGLWLALTLAPVLVLAPANARAEPLAEHDYVGVGKCRSCHKKELMGNQVAVWQKGPHHRAFQTLLSEASLAIAAERGLASPPHESAECLRCHVTAHAVPPVRIANEVDPADGVQCESCHGPGRDYRKKKIMSDEELARKKGLWDAEHDAAICTACHNEESPTFDPARYALTDGTKVGFDFELAKQRFPHEIPADVKGRYVELEKEQKAAEKAAKAAAGAAPR